MKKFLYVPTPLDCLNLLFVGGLRFPSICEIFGKKAGGKSAFFYQTVGNFLKEHKNGKVVFIDQESAVRQDRIRLELVYGWDFSRIEMLPNKVDNVTTLEGGFDICITRIENMSKKDVLCFFWDTPAAAPTNNEYEQIKTIANGGQEKLFAGGMQEIPRIIKGKLKKVMNLMAEEDKNIISLLPNQVYNKINSYGGAKTQSCGGEPWGHDLHYSFEVEHVKDFYFGQKEKSDESAGKTLQDAEYSLKRLSIRKSRYSPVIVNLPMVVHSADGGRIDSERSLVLAGSEYGFLYQPSKGWWSLKDHEGKYRKGEIHLEETILAGLREMIKEKYKSQYYLIRETYNWLEGNTHQSK